MNYDQIIAKLEEGDSLNYLCKTYDLKYGTLYKKIKKSHPDLLGHKNRSAQTIERMKQAQMFDLDVAEIIRLYTEEKKPAAEIAKQFGVVQNVILKRLHEAGVPMNNQGDYWTDERREHQRGLCFDGIIGVHSQGPGSYRFTKIERQFASWCDDRNIGYVRQFQLQPKHHRYDFRIENTNLLVEIDGEYWHTRPHQIVKDKIFIDEAANMGYDVLRFTDREMEATNLACFERIYEWILLPSPMLT